MNAGSSMTPKQRMRVTEFQRRLKNLISAARAVERCFEMDDGNATLAPDHVIEEVRRATKAALSKDN
jgi:hypothetical protein